MRTDLFPVKVWLFYHYSIPADAVYLPIAGNDFAQNDQPVYIGDDSTVYAEKQPGMVCTRLTTADGYDAYVLQDTRKGEPLYVGFSNPDNPEDCVFVATRRTMADLITPKKDTPDESE